MSLTNIPGHAYSLSGFEQVTNSLSLHFSHLQNGTTLRQTSEDFREEVVTNTRKGTDTEQLSNRELLL